jgi:hypothetical protein
LKDILVPPLYKILGISVHLLLEETRYKQIAQAVQAAEDEFGATWGIALGKVYITRQEVKRLSLTK